MIVEITSYEQLKAYQESGAPLCIDFYATWCGPCRMLTPRLKDFSYNRDYSDVKFLKVDVDKFGEISELYGITCMPTIIFQTNETILKKIEGFDLEGIKNTLDILVKKE